MGEKNFANFIHFGLELIKTPEDAHKLGKFTGTAAPAVIILHTPDHIHIFTTLLIMCIAFKYHCVLRSENLSPQWVGGTSFLTDYE